MSHLRIKAEKLATKAIANPKLLEQLPTDTYETFVLSVAVFNKKLAMQLDDIKPITNASNKVLFWEAVGILLPQQDFS